MKVMVIPDIHLKPWMFERASELMEEKTAEKAVCLMDIADDWNQQYNSELYIETFGKAARFAQDHPETLWCYGNHDLCYLWNQRESGYSRFASQIVLAGLQLLRETVPDEKQLAYIHRIDDVIFLHGGLTAEFVRDHVSSGNYHRVDRAIEIINSLGLYAMWREESPIWFRPQYCGRAPAKIMYKPKKLLQVVGHTPMWNIVRQDNVLSCDVFSTTTDNKPIGPQQFPVIDTKTWEYYLVK